MKVKNLLGLILCTLAALSLSGCDREDPNPEIRDPIYLDIKKQSEEAQKSLDAEVKSIEDLRKKLASTEPRTKERVVAERDLAKALRSIDTLTQKTKYLTIRTERRRLEARRDYKLSRQKGEPWPDPQEFEKYKRMKSLQASSRNWDSRVPKLSDRLPKPLKPGAEKSAD